MIRKEKRFGAARVGPGMAIFRPTPGFWPALLTLSKPASRMRRVPILKS